METAKRVWLPALVVLMAGVWSSAPAPVLAEGEPAEGEPAEGEPAEGEPAEGEPAEGEPAAEPASIDPDAAELVAAPAPSPDARRDPEYFRARSREVTAEEVLLWIPRILLFPLHVVTEYVLRAPVVALLTWAERNDVFEILGLIFSPTPDFSWSPSLSLEAGVFVVPGLQARWRNMGVPGHELRVAGTFGGDTFWSASLRDRWSFEPVVFGVRGLYSTRPDRAFFGLGPESPNARRNFAETLGEADAMVGLHHEDHVHVDLSVGYAYEAITLGLQPSFDPAEIVGVAGLGPYDLTLVHLDVHLDTRREVEENGGICFHANGTYGLDARDRATEFITVDLELEAAVEVSHPDRVVAARVRVGESAPLGSAPIPLTHLPSLGWNNHQGFVLGRFRGEAYFLAEVRYRYPVQYFLDLQWTVSVGNVFARDFSNFSADALTGTIGVGLRTRRTGADPIEMTFALGTTRFDSNFGIEGVRFYLSTTEGL